jgi:hypothetical protein
METDRNRKQKFIISSLYFCILFLLHTVVHAQDTLQARIILIGDAGQLTNGKHPVVNSVKKNIPLNEKTTIVYLGDNLYKTGLPDNSLPTFDIAKAPLDSQINIAGKSKAKVYFVPGNHDWAVGSSNGWESILRVQSYIDFLGNENVKMFPRDGCPGPVTAKITDDVLLVMMDTQWWLHLGDKPGIESDCPYKTKEEVLVQLEDILTRNSGKLVLIAFHHTFRTYSPHGGYFTWKQHIFPFTDMRDYLYIPLPVVGSIYPLTRAVFGVEQDLKSPPYQAMVNEIESVVKGHDNVIFAAGHDHSLQIIQDSGYNYITSGSAAKNSRVSKGKNSLYASPLAGYITLDISKNKKVQANVFVVENDSTRMDYSNHILDFSKLPEKPAENTRVVDYKFRDSVVISASEKYKPVSGFQKFFLGQNYRQQWSTPIKMQEFNIRKEKGGFTIKGLSGGKRSKSLQLVDKNGKEWTIRSVEKDIEKVVPPELRNSLSKEMVEDMVSTSHPHAPLVVPGLARAAGVPAAEPEFFYVPDDPALGLYRKTFANTVVLLEMKAPGAGWENAKTTGNIINTMLEDNEHHVDQEKVLTARLLDMFIGDWDRHAGQWEWGTTDTGVGKLYFPIPRDRNQAFSNPDGFLIDKVSKRLMPFLQGFEAKIENINQFNYQTRDFDRFFMNHLDEKTWERITKEFQSRMVDTVIENAVKKFPQPIYAIDGKIVADKLKSRRDQLFTEAMTYYKFISKVVTVTGSNKSEYFHVKKHPDGLQVTAYKKVNATDSASVMYTRVFNDNTTKEIRLYGLNGNDKFEIDADVTSDILLRIIGGKGNDTFNLKGNIKNKVYDISHEKNASINLVKSKTYFLAEPSVNDYRMTDFRYGRIRPIFELGHNTEDAFLVGAGIGIRTYGFRKDPYSTDQRLSALYAPMRDAYRINYNGTFNKVLFRNDLVVRSEFVNPTISNFFGFGNRSVYDKTKSADFYRVRYSFFEIDALMRKRSGSMIQMSIGPSYAQYWSRYQDNSKRILGEPANIGTDSLDVYGTKQYLGAKARFDINYVNNELFPTRGITWYTELASMYGLKKNANNLTRFTTDISIYASLKDDSRVGAIFRLGAGHLFTKNYDYFQALSLGAHNVLRGYRKNRFSGSSSAYASTELRVKLFKSQTNILPGDVGVMGFYDIGRVWHKGESSHKWHGAYGGGLYFVPYGLTMLSFTAGFSPEDKLFNFTLASKFKLVF